MKKLVLTYGIISGLIVILVMFLGFSLSSSADLSIGTSQLIGYAGMLIALSLIFFAVKNFRDNILDGVITFGNAFKIGLFISLVVTVFYVTAWMAYSTTEDGQKVMETYTEQYAKEISESDLSDEEKAIQLEEMAAQMEMYESSAFIRILFTIIEILPVGVIVSVICALILKRKEPQIQMES